MIDTPDIREISAPTEATQEVCNANSRVSQLGTWGGVSELPARDGFADGMVSGESPERVCEAGYLAGRGEPDGWPKETPSAAFGEEESGALGDRALPGEKSGALGDRALPGEKSGALGPALRDALPTEEEWMEARGREAVCVEFERLRGEGWSLRQAARAVGKAASWFSGDESPYVKWQRMGLEGLLPERRKAGAPDGELSQIIKELGWFLPAAVFFYMHTNRTADSGSVPEAVRRTISLPTVPIGWTEKQKKRFLSVLKLQHVPVCPAELREMILARQALGMDLVPETIAKLIIQSRILVEFTRNPTNAMLKAVNARGGSKFTRRDGEAVPLRCGQRMTPDDGSINFVVWVPWSFPTDVCSRKFGCMVGRFQLLLFVDALSISIRARSFVVRPRSSYRQEDALHLYNVFMSQWGVPEEIWHEGNIWNAGRVKDCLDLLKVRRHLTHSPHNKQAVEGRFDKLWTVMSGLTGGQIGRFRGEMERENEILTSCKAGHTDPRKVFPSLQTALAVIDQAIGEANATPVKTDVGMFVPDELWGEQVGTTPLRKLEGGTEWMFAPWCVERVINNGMTIKVPLFEDFSVPFTFASEWMPEFHKARARVYLDPYLDKCRGKVVLAQDFNGVKSGTVLGDATQTNDIGEYGRLMLGLGTGPSDAGRVLRQRQAAAMRSDRRAITGDGRGLSVVEERDGAGSAAKWEQRQRSEVGGQRSEGDGNEVGGQRSEVRRVDLMGETGAVSRPASADARYDDYRD